MNKKLIALILSCVMLVSASPAVAAEDTSVKPTIEEILNDYHQKAFDAQSAEDAGHATTYSNRSGGKTLEQETVDTLNAAGYEAYNVTASNYYALEAELNTDFASIGLNPNSSYVIVISGEDSDNSNNTWAYGDNLITPTPDPTEAAYFEYTYNGTVYRMRYVTITANDDPMYGKVSSADLLNHFNAHELLEDGLNATVYAMADYLGGCIPIGTIASLCGIQVFDFDMPSFQTLSMVATTNWTRRYIQVWDDYLGSWSFGASVEYVNVRSYMSGDYYDPALNRYVSFDKNEITDTRYSDHYNDHTWWCEQAVLGFHSMDSVIDMTGTVRYYYDGNEVITHREDF